MNQIPYEIRRKVYTRAREVNGLDKQLVVAVEELSEVQKEICKVLRGEGSMAHLAEEIADATIMLEQLRLFFDINQKVCEQMDAKMTRLAENVFNVQEDDADGEK